MSEPKLISPMLDGFLMGDPISDHNGVRCCPALKKDTEDRYIVKIISTPASQIQVDALLLSGAYPDKEAVIAYYNSLAEDVVKEAQILSKLSKLEGFQAFESCQIEAMEGEETGYDTYLLSIYQRSLQQHLRHHAPTHLEALNLGLDMCAALTVCRQSGYLYVDLKPGNIYITDQGYKIGDLGFVNLGSLKYASLPERYRSQYTAPEISDAYAALNTTIDIYALGLILYQVFNNGQLPFKDEIAPGEVFPAPAYADYEMAEIILRACAPDPADRWQDPADMGQALVSYMQRNGAHNTPITPTAEAPAEETADEEEREGAFEATETEESAAETPEEAVEPVNDSQEEADSNEPNKTEAAATEEPEAETEEEPETEEKTETPETAETVDESSIFTEDKEGNLTFLLNDGDDETVPDENAEFIEAEVSEEVSDMLQQADELIAHPTPDPVVQPEPIDVPIPPIPEDAPAEESEEPKDKADENSEEAAEAEESQPKEESENAEAKTEEETEDEEESTRRSPWPWIRNILLVLLALGLIAAGIFFYRNYYLQPIESIILDESQEGKLTVHVTSQVSEEKLIVLCADTYGNQLSAPVKDGKAVFTGLAPNSAYTVNVKINGFHRLTGDTTAAFTTPSLTEIVQMNCVTGAEDGSIVVSFTINGPDSDQWRISCADDSGFFNETVFAGHTVTLSGFTVGTEYTFTLSPVEDITVTGQTQAVYTAKNIVTAKDLVITGCANGTLTARWTAPEGVTVDSWTVRCYNDKGFDETTVVTDCAAEFTVPEANADYTLEVTAEGMSVNERAYAPANALAVKDFKADYNAGALSLSWVPTDSSLSYNWRISCTIDGSAAREYTSEQETSLIITPVVPGATYKLALDNSDGNTVLGGTITVRIPQAQDFEGYDASASEMELRMCHRPSWKGWDRYDVPSSDYTTEFSAGDSSAFVIHLNSEYDTSSDEITSLFVIRNQEGQVVSIATSTETWTRMWYRNYCELDIPELPQAAGKYTITVYFNNQFVKTVDFTIV